MCKREQHFFLPFVEFFICVIFAVEPSVGTARWGRVEEVDSGRGGYKMLEIFGKRH